MLAVLEEEHVAGPGLCPSLPWGDVVLADVLRVGERGQRTAEKLKWYFKLTDLSNGIDD